MLKNIRQSATINGKMVIKMHTIVVTAVVPADINSVTEAIGGVDVDGAEWVTGEVTLVELVVAEVVAVAVSLQPLRGQRIRAA